MSRNSSSTNQPTVVTTATPVLLTTKAGRMNRHGERVFNCIHNFPGYQMEGGEQPTLEQAGQGSDCVARPG
jgi:hypothetical protein